MIVFMAVVAIAGIVMAYNISRYEDEHRNLDK